MAESNPLDLKLSINPHSEKPQKFDLNQFNRLAPISERGLRALNGKLPIVDSWKFEDAAVGRTYAGINCRGGPLRRSVFAQLVQSRSCRAALLEPLASSAQIR